MMEDNQNNNNDLFIAFYNSARQELIERLKQRDTIVGLYLTITSVSFTIILNSKNIGMDTKVNFSAISVFISFLSLAFCCSIANNQIKIATLGRYIRCELMSTLKHNNLPDWETSKILKKSSIKAIVLQGVFYDIIFLFPQVFDMCMYIYRFFYVHNNLKCGSNGYSYLWIDFTLFNFIIIISILTFIVLRKAKKERIRLNKI